jgi:two-component system sensor histidine kinase YesM
LKLLTSLYIPLRVKFIIIFVTLITIPFAISGIVTYHEYMSQVKANTTINVLQITDQIKVNLDRFTKDLERLSVFPFYDSEVMDILTNSSEPGAETPYIPFNVQQKMSLFISSLEFDRPEIRRIVMLAPDGRLFSSRSNISTNWARESEPWIKKIESTNGELIILKPHVPGYVTTDNTLTVSVIRKILQPYTNKYLGIIKIDLSAKAFSSFITPVYNSSESHLKLSLLDQENNLLYPFQSDAPLVQQPSAEQNEDNFLRISVESEYSGIQVVGTVPSKLQQDAYRMIRFTLITSGVALILAYLLAMYMANRFVKPIRHLRSKMWLVQRGSFNERVQVTTNDEIGFLSKGFNNMVSEIGRLVKEVYETRIRERDAELSALQSQINPHFLYNTLESMNVVAMKYKMMDLSDIICHLGNLLRYTVYKQELPVFLRDELRFVESYLEIESLRLGDRLTLFIHVDSSLENCLIPKLILQPFVENVIEHGFKSSESRIEVEISAWVEGDDLIIRIVDDGKGMTTEQQQQLQENMTRENNAGEFSGFAGNRIKGVALRNVFQRLYLRYGAAYGVSVENREGMGTAFQIRVPFQWGNEAC